MTAKIPGIPIKVGDRVIDLCGKIGKVINLDDIHNVQVEYGNGNIGLYCLDHTCDNFDPLYMLDRNPDEGVDWLSFDLQEINGVWKAWVLVNGEEIEATGPDAFKAIDAIYEKVEKLLG